MLASSSLSVLRRLHLWPLALIGSAVALLGHLLLITLVYHDSRVLAVSSNVYQCVVGAVALAASLVVTRQLPAGDRLRRSAAMLVLALVWSLLAQLTWTSFVIAGSTHPAVPPSAVFVILFNLTFAAGLGLHPAALARPFARARFTLELLSTFLAAALGFALLGVAAFGFETLRALPMWPLVLFSPASAAALFIALVTLLHRPLPAASRTTLTFLWLGAAARLLTDVVYCYLVATDAYVDGGLSDVGYTAELLLFTLACVWKYTHPMTYPAAVKSAAGAEQRPRGLMGAGWRLLVPQLGLLLNIGVLIWTHFNPEALDFRYAAAVSVAVLALLSAREVVARLEIAGLYRRERELAEGLRRSRDELE
jgi:hypothetical protein